MERNRSSDHAVSRDIQNGKMGEKSTEASGRIEPTESGRNEVEGLNDIRAKVKRYEARRRRVRGKVASFRFGCLLV
jgi:hypothetical protein